MSFGENVPVPLVVQIPVLFVVTAVIANGLPAQELSLEVMREVGVDVNVTIVVSKAAIQFPLPVDVRNSITVPAVVSAELGVYVEFTPVKGKNVPEPLVDQFAPDATVTVPVTGKLVVSLQTNMSGPAFTVGPA